MRNIDVIVEARMTSTRLPGKVLLSAAGKPMLAHMIERLRRIPNATGIIVATTTNATDDPIVALAAQEGVRYFRGSEHDVLGRVVAAAQQFDTDVIVEITGDDPLLDVTAAARVIDAYLAHEATIDFVTNDQPQTYPLGWNTRAFSRQLLERVERTTAHPVDREHVVNYIVQHPQEFRIMNVEAEGFVRRPEIRLTLDTQLDYEVMGAVFAALYPENPAFTGRDMIAFLDAHPEIRDRNVSVVQRTYSYG